MDMDAASQQTQISQSSDRALARMQQEQQQATLRVQESLATAAANSAHTVHQNTVAEVSEPYRFVFSEAKSSQVIELKKKLTSRPFS